jgi:hypothetical protein
MTTALHLFAPFVNNGDDACYYCQQPADAECHGFHLIVTREEYKARSKPVECSNCDNLKSAVLIQILAANTLREGLAKSEEVGKSLAKQLQKSIERNSRLVAKLKVFADFADPHRKMPRELVISHGSPIAKRQLTMGDCYDAVDAVAGGEES